MLTQLSVCARTPRSQVETGCGPRVTAAALAGAVAATVARPTVAVARAMIAPIRRLLFIHTSGGVRTPGRADVASGKADTMGNTPPGRLSPRVSDFPYYFRTKWLDGVGRKDDVSRHPAPR